MILAVLEFIEGGLLLGIAIAFFYYGNLLSNFPWIGAIINAICMAFGAIFMLFAILYFVLGWGMMTLKMWARRITMILTILTLIFSLLNIMGAIMVINAAPAIFGIVFGMLLMSFLILFYLTRPAVKAAFEPPQPIVVPVAMVPYGAPPGYPPQQMPPPGYYPQQQAPPPGYAPPPAQYGYSPPPQAPPPGYAPPQQPPPPY